MQQTTGRSLELRPKIKKLARINLSNRNGNSVTSMKINFQILLPLTSLCHITKLYLSSTSCKHCSMFVVCNMVDKISGHLSPHPTPNHDKLTAASTNARSKFCTNTYLFDSECITTARLRRLYRDNI